MRAVSAIACAALLCCCGPAGAADSKADSPEEIKVNALRDPEVRKYAAIVAGLDAFDGHRALAPKVETLRSRVEPRGGREPATLPGAHLGGNDGFSLALPVDAGGYFVVPRSEAALDAKSELVLNQKRRDYRVTPVVRSPGLPDNMRRLGDLRLECRVQVAIIKEEIPLWVVLAANTLLRTRDWCGFRFEGKSAGFTFRHGKALHGAVLVDGNRSALLETEGKGFRVPLGDASWSDGALVELELEAPDAVTGTGGETPRTGP